MMIAGCLKAVRFACLSVAVLVLLVPGSAAAAAGAPALSPRQAINHVGHIAVVCGHVAGTHFARSSKGRPTFINLGTPYPNQVFTIVVWGDDLGNFRTPPRAVHGDVCVHGLIRAYRGVAEMEVSDPAQITRP